jgi:hypothetical protein
MFLLSLVVIVLVINARINSKHEDLQKHV